MKSLSAISLFTGVGGLDLGFEAAGFETAAAVEMDPVACRVLTSIRPNWPVLAGDIHQIPTPHMLATASLAPGEADILIGGPPCQPFSKSGYWARGDALRLEDPRAGTLGEFLRVLREAKPRTFMLENVPGLGFRGKDEGLRFILQSIQLINETAGTNYRAFWRKLNAVDYGVPQIRERLFLIASKDGRDFKFPNPTHFDPEAGGEDGQREPWRTAWDAIGDLPASPNERGLAMTGKWSQLLPSIPEGQNYLWHTSRGGGLCLFGWRRRYWSFLLKLAKNRPSWTIQAQPGSAIGPFHWANRKLSSVELCRLQTLPSDVSLSCSRTESQRLLGNAVPSLMAEVLAREIRTQLLDQPMPGPLRLMPVRRTPVPPAEPIVKAPSRYHALIGDYEDHPGTGLGWSKQSRPANSTAVVGK